MGSRFKDFDAAFAEETHDPIIVRLFDREWEIPAEPRLADILAASRKIADGEGSSFDSARAYIGPEAVDAWVELGLQPSQLRAVYDFVAVERGDSVGDDPGEDQPAATPAGTASSNGGRSSKRTSGASTESN